jgi:hypothetical protein
MNLQQFISSFLLFFVVFSSGVLPLTLKHQGIRPVSSDYNEISSGLVRRAEDPENIYHAVIQAGLAAPPRTPRGQLHVFEVRWLPKNPPPENNPSPLDRLTAEIGGRHFGLVIGEFASTGDVFKGKLIHLIFAETPKKDKNNQKIVNGVPVIAKIANFRYRNDGSIVLRHLKPAGSRFRLATLQNFG